MKGARDYLDQAGIGLPQALACQQSTSIAGGRSGCAMLLELADRPTAIIGGIDLIAIGCVVEAQARGMSVPGDLSVVGIDDLDHVSTSVAVTDHGACADGADRHGIGPQTRRHPERASGRPGDRSPGRADRPPVEWALHACLIGIGAGATGS